MSQYFLFQDTKNCIGCQSCQVVCKSNKSLPVGPKPCLVVPIEPKMVDGMPRGAFIFMPCFHLMITCMNSYISISMVLEVSPICLLQ